MICSIQPYNHVVYFKCNEICYKQIWFGGISCSYTGKHVDEIDPTSFEEGESHVLQAHGKPK